MSFRVPQAGQAGRPRFRARPRLVLALVGVVILIVVILALAGVYTDFLWFQSVHYSSVFTTRLRTEALLFVVFGLFMAVVVGANIVVAHRLRPPFRAMSQEQQSLERYRVAIDPVRRWVVIAICVLIGLFAGASASGQWRTWLLWRNAVTFGVKDAQFHRDVSYFTFTYPFQRFLLGVLFTAVLLSLVASVVVHYLYGALRIQTPGEKATPAARAHISVLLGAFLLLKAAAYWLDRYGLAFSPRGVVTGPSYTDVNATLPAKTILVFVAVICALLFFANVFTRNWTLPAVAFALMVLSAIVIGGVYPAIVEQFQVKPSEADKEAPYIARNIAATRQAFGLTPDVLTTSEFAGTSTEPPTVLRTKASTDAQIRLLDPNLVAPTFEQLQQQRAFYGFPDSLDIDRYPTGGSSTGSLLTDTVVAARELDLSGLTSDQNNWINRHLVYTHGFGFVAAPTDIVDAEGRPAFSESDIPPTGSLGSFEPRIYFGENSPDYSIVGAPKGAPARELDRPSDVQGGTGQVNTTYTGKGGVAIGSMFRRLLYAMHFREKNFVLSSGLNGASRVMYIRDPRDRVAQVAPWLTLDGDPYPAVVGGRILWILDGYTTSDGYPYSEREQLGDVTRDTLTATGAVAAQANRPVNYIRNSIKATVDAYDGTVTLYEWNEPAGRADPVRQTWEKAFPGTVRPESAMPAALRTHLRYPEDLFKVQRSLLTRYHVSDARAFYNGTDFWLVPNDPTKDTTVPQPPYYLTLAAGNSPSPVFSLTSALVATNKRNLTAFLTVSSQPGVDYGKMQLLVMPRNQIIDGPGQVQNNWENDPTVSTQLTLLRGGGSQVELGNLLTIPLGGGLLYVEPVYVKAAGGTSFPQLRRVLASFGDRIAFSNDLASTLDQVFGVAAAPTTPTVPTAPTAGNGALQQALAAAQQALADASAALKRGDFAAYGEAQKRLADAIAKAAAASKTTTSSSASPSRSAAPSPSASP